jgi:NADH-quinone oxidoreductase subunit I
MQGMYVTLLQMIRPKVTEQYPENRGKKEVFERFRGELTMPHDAGNQHQCTACRICETNCPNGTIRITVKSVTDESTGKEKKALDTYLYDTGSCIFCELCTRSCPQDAIRWTPNFEHAVFTQEKLIKQLNRKGSSLKQKTKS